MGAAESRAAAADMAEPQPMIATDRSRTLVAASATGPASLDLHWSDGTRACIEVGDVLDDQAFAALRDPAIFDGVTLGDWGHSLVWPSGDELGADALWRRTLSATGRDDARRFLDWRLRHGLSLSAAAAALGVSRRMVAYYSNGEKTVPRPILLACRGWEVEARAAA